MDNHDKDQCGFCHTGEETVSTCGRLYSRKGIGAHRKCMQYSATLAQYECTTFGGFDIDEVKKEIKRGSRLRCHHCKNVKDLSALSSGASAGCAWSACSRTFHFACARHHAVTRRIVFEDKLGRENVLYRVFCKEDHLNLFVKKYCQELDVQFTEDSDEDWEAESDPETESTKHRLDTSASPSGIKEEQKLSSGVELKQKAQCESEVKQESKEAPDMKTQKTVPPRRKMRPTKREPEPSMFEVIGSSDDEACKENENSLTESEEGDISRRRYTRNQMQMVESKMPGCMTPEKRRKQQQRSSPRLLNSESTNQKKLDTSQLMKAKLQESPKTKLGEIRSENLRSSPRRTSPRKQKDVNENKERRQAENSGLENVNKISSVRSPATNRKLSSTHHNVIDAKKLSMTADKTSALNSIKKEHNSFARKRPREESKKADPVNEWKTAKREVNKGNHFLQEDLNDAFVICILEDKYAVMTDSLHITRMVQKQFVIAEHRMTRWKYGGDEELNHDQMLYLMRDVTKALAEGNHSEVYRLLFDLGSKDLEWYQKHIDFNQSLGDLNKMLEIKLRENIVDNLAVAQQNSNRRLGCVINLTDDAIMLVLLVNDYLDGGFKIRTKLGHSFTTHLWNSSTFAKDLSQFTSDVTQYFNKLELQNLCELLEYKMKDSTFELFFKPSDALLQLKNTDRVAERLRFFLKLKKKSLETKARSHNNVLFIGPVDTVCINTKAYCQKSIPLFVEENLTACKDVFIVVDFAVGCGIHGIEDLFALESVPPRADFQVWSAFNPAIVPVTCVLIHFRIR